MSDFTLKYLIFYFLFLFGLAGIAQDSDTLNNDLLFLDAILLKHNVDEIDKLPVKELRKISDEFDRISHKEENVELINTILNHTDFKKLENYQLEQILLQAKLYYLDGDMKSAIIYYDSLIALDDSGYFAGRGALGNLYTHNIKSDSLKIDNYFRIAEQAFLREKHYFELGIVYYQMGRLYASKNPRYAIESFTQGIKYFDKCDEKELRVVDYLASIYTYRGVIENSLGNIVNAYKDFTNGDIWANLSKRPTKIAWVSNSLGLYYSTLRIYDSSKVYFERALYFNEKLGDEFWIAINKMNFSSALFYGGDKESAIKQIKEGIALITEKNLEYEYSGKTQLAIFYLKTDSILQAEFIANDIIHKYKVSYGDDSPMMALPLAIKAWILVKNKKNEEAKLTIQKALDLIDKQAIPIKQKKVYEIVYNTYYDMGEYKLAFDYFSNVKLISDSLTGSKVYLQLLSMEKETFNKMLKVQNEKNILEQEKNVVQLEKEKLRKYISYGGVFFLVLLLSVIFNRLRVTNRQKKIIEAEKKDAEYQRNLVQVKNKEILDSINYAKRLQDAILPPSKLVSSYLLESFIIYKPKDIVAGDFYFMDVIEENLPTHPDGSHSGRHGNKKLIYYVAADCTGHGVPGAMVSIVGANGLKRCIQEFGLRDPGKILDQLSQLVSENFSQSEEKIRDGMDLALCCLEMENDKAIKVHYAGANNPLWVINSNRKEIPSAAIEFKEGGGFEIKANKQAIGYTENVTPFTTHSFDVEDGDTLYTFSDGYPDQFGGQLGKKYKSANFRKFLLNIQDENMDEQKKLVNEEFENWKGELEQVDDVCVIGVRL